jgi:hypothetical protein
MANPSNTHASAQIDNNGNAPNLVLFTTGSLQHNPVLEVFDNTPASRYAIYQNGDSRGNNLIMYGTSQTFPNMGPGSGGNCVGISSAGVLYRSTAATC